MHKIILADNEAIFGDGITNLLATEDDLRIVARCPDPPRLYHAITNFRGAIVIVASSLPTDMAQVIAGVRSAASRIIMIAENRDSPPPATVTKLNGLVYRSVSRVEMLETIRKVIRGEQCIPQVEAAKSVKSEDIVGATVRERLAPREMKIVALIIQGCKNKEIALRLGTTEQVIKNYLHNIYDKTGVSDRLELALFIIHHSSLARAATSIGNELMGQGV